MAHRVDWHGNLAISEAPPRNHLQCHALLGGADHQQMSLVAPKRLTGRWLSYPPPNWAHNYTPSLHRHHERDRHSTVVGDTERPERQAARLSQRYCPRYPINGVCGISFAGNPYRRHHRPRHGAGQMAYRFEWDNRKAGANLGKHGIGFEEASTVFDAPLAANFDDEAHSAMETRELIIGHSVVDR